MSISSAALIAQSGLNTITTESSVLSRNISVLSRNITGASSTSNYSLKTANIITTPYGSVVVSISRATNQAGRILAQSQSPIIMGRPHRTNWPWITPF